MSSITTLSSRLKHIAPLWLTLALWLGGCASNCTPTSSGLRLVPQTVPPAPASLMVAPPPSGSYWSELTSWRSDARTTLSGSPIKFGDSKATPKP